MSYVNRLKVFDQDERRALDLMFKDIWYGSVRQHDHSSVFEGGLIDASSVDHGGLSGLSDDDHTQYALLAGRSGGQTLKGGTASGDDLTLMSTNHATKGNLFFGNSTYDEVNDRLGIGTLSPEHAFHVGSATNAATATALLERNTTTTAASVTTAGLLATTSGDMADGFGISFEFEIRDSAAVRNNIGAIRMIRDGADNSGRLELRTVNAGSGATKMRISSAGDIGMVAGQKFFVDGVTLAGNTYFLESAADVFDLYTNAVLRLSIDATGRVMQPTQPCFLVTNGTGATDVTGDGTLYTVLWPTEVYDIGSNFASNTFTAPVTGKYLLSATVLFQNVLVTHTDIELRIVTSNRAYRVDRAEALAANVSLTVTALADMDASDTATVQIIGLNGTKTIDVFADARYVFFSGSLIN